MNTYFNFQHTSTTETEICVRTYDSGANRKDVIEVDYLVVGGRSNTNPKQNINCLSSSPEFKVDCLETHQKA